MTNQIIKLKNNKKKKHLRILIIIQISLRQSGISSIDNASKDLPYDWDKKARILVKTKQKEKRYVTTLYYDDMKFAPKIVQNLKNLNYQLTWKRYNYKKTKSFLRINCKSFTKEKNKNNINLENMIQNFRLKFMIIKIYKDLN